MAKRQTKKKYIVVFQDEEGKVLATSFVEEGSQAQPPAVPEKRGETARHETVFAGWDQDISRVESNLVVKAVYETVPKKYLVMYFNENGAILGTETVAYGESAREPWQPEKESTPEYYYEFTGWGTDLNRIEGDTMAKASFEPRRRKYTVRFFHEDGRLISEQDIFYGQAARAPGDPVKEEDERCTYPFEGWDVDFSEITGPLDVHAVFSTVWKEFKTSFYIDGEEAGEQIARYGEDIAYPMVKKKGYELVWDPMPLTVTEDRRIDGKQIFTNTKGSRLSDGGSLYEIINPSVSAGTVRLISWNEKDDVARVPDRVRLGEFCYRVEEIGGESFAGADRVKEIRLPGTVREICGRGIAGCRNLRIFRAGKGLKKIGKNAFRGTPRLKEIDLREASPDKIDRSAFEGISRQVKVLKNKNGKFLKNVLDTDS